MKDSLIGINEGIEELRVQEIDKTIRGKADTPASFPAVKGMRGK